MKKNNNPFERIVLPVMAIVLLTSFRSYSQSTQTLNNERRQIIGTWVMEDDDWTFSFSKDSSCIEYLEGKISDRYTYKILPVNSAYCAKEFGVTNLSDTITIYLQLTNIKTKELTCFIMNGFTPTTMSLMGAGQLKVFLFIRKKVIENKSKQ
jgi:hypothetical protein